MLGPAAVARDGEHLQRAGQEQERTSRDGHAHSEDAPEGTGTRCKGRLQSGSPFKGYLILPHLQRFRLRSLRPTHAPAEQGVDLPSRDHRSRPVQRPICKFSCGADEAGIGCACESAANADALDANLGSQPVVKVWRRTETGEAPRGPGATTKNTGSI